MSWTRRGWRARPTGATFGSDSRRSGAPPSTSGTWRRSELAKRTHRGRTTKKSCRRRSRRCHRARIAIRTKPSLRPRQAGFTPTRCSANAAHDGPACGNAQGRVSAAHAQVACVGRRRPMWKACRRGVCSTHRFDASSAIRMACCARGRRRFTVISYGIKCE